MSTSQATAVCLALSANVDHHPLRVILTPSRWGSGYSIPKPILDDLVNFSPKTHLHYEILGVFDTSVALSDLHSTLRSSL